MGVYLAAFDTPSDERRRVIVKTLRKCGHRVQKSVFVLHPRVGVVGWLRGQMGSILTHEDRFLLFEVAQPGFWWSVEELPQWSAIELV